MLEKFREYIILNYLSNFEHINHINSFICVNIGI